MVEFINMAERLTPGDPRVEGEPHTKLAEAWVRRSYKEDRSISTRLSQYMEISVQPEDHPDELELKIAIVSSALAPFFRDSSTFNFNDYFALSESLFSHPGLKRGLTAQVNALDEQTELFDNEEKKYCH